MTTIPAITPLEDAVPIMKQGGIVLYPTETYFGIGCRVGADESIARIFQIKKRLYAMPLPIIAGTTEQIDMVARIPGNIVQDLEKVYEQFWPAPLSVILPAKSHISPLLTGGTGNIAVRISPHPVPLYLAQHLGEPLVASSANISGEAPVTQVSELSPELAKKVDAILDWFPASRGGAPSTLVEFTGNGHIKVLRQGAISLEELKNAGFRQEEL